MMTIDLKRKEGRREAESENAADDVSLLERIVIPSLRHRLAPKRPDFAYAPT